MYQAFYQQKKPFWVRYTALIVALAVVMCAFSVRLAELQVVNADYYKAQGDTSSVRTLTVSAARGEIVDRYGRVLVYNRDGFNIVFDAAALPNSKTNSIILKLIKLLKGTEIEWTDTLPMEKELGYSFVDDKQTDISTLRTTLGLARYATAENCFDAMVERYSLEGLSPQEQRLIMGVRYAMESSDFSTANPFTFAEDVGDKLAQTVQEYYSDLPGVVIEKANFREYTDPTLAPHVLGYTGLMSATDWEKYKDTGEYRYSDKVGKAGIELAAEEYLKGVDGKFTVVQNADGTHASTETVREAVPVSTVQLTLDANLQKVAQEALKNGILRINSNPENTSPATSGAVVVTDVNTGEILASANYPSYSMVDYFDDYKSVETAEGQPLFDRALNGQYPPGSTFKPAVALIGLHLNKIGTYDTIRCTHTYDRFDDYKPTCLGWHGSLNVTTALAKSCNFFFYELGFRIGITDLNKYCRQLGLGVSTQVELPSTTGILAGKEYSESVGGYWTQGNTVQAAIGQSDNAFSPLQLAMYTSTVANGGTRYNAHFIKSVYNYSMTEMQQDNFSYELSKVDISAESFEAVKGGMLQVTEDGTASATFSNYPIRVGGKTGTADAPGKTNAMFVAFAPYTNPEIAVSIVIENGGHGSSVAPVAKEIFDAYFFNSDEPYSSAETDKLLP